VVRIETPPLEKTAPIFMAKMRSVYPHDEVFGQYCTVKAYIDCPPAELFEHMGRSTGFVGAFALARASPADTSSKDHRRPPTRQLQRLCRGGIKLCPS